MQYTLRAFRSMLALTVCSLLFAGCATNGEAKVPDPGSKKWYAQRMEEIEASKAAGKLTDEQYLSLKNEADATRAEYQNANRQNGNYYNTPHGRSGVGIGIGTFR